MDSVWLGMMETQCGDCPDKLDFYTATADHIKERMDQGLTDVGLLLEPVNMDKYDFIRLEKMEQWIAVMHPDSPLAEKEAVTVEDLKGLPLILPRRLSVQSELASWFGEDIGKLDALFTSNLPSNSNIMVHNRLACALIIKGSISFWDERKIAYSPLSPELKASGVTAKAAKMLSKAVNADLYEIQPEIPYTQADLNWMDKKSRSSIEMNDPASRPAIAGKVTNMNDYDAVFVGFPIWLAYHNLIQCTQA